MKIVEAINNIITNKKKISNVLKSNNEFFFLYNQKYKWSIMKGDQGNFMAFVYPDESKSLEDLAHGTDFSSYRDFVTFNTSDIKTREAEESFSELYNLVAGKVLGVDDILDDIINDV